MLSRLIRFLKTDEENRRSSRGFVARGEVVLRSRRYAARGITRDRVTLDGCGGQFTKGQKFAFQLFIEGLAPGQLFVCVGMVESIDGDTMAAVYLVEGTAARRAHQAFWDAREGNAPQAPTPAPLARVPEPRGQRA